MNAHSKDEIREIILKDIQLIYNRSAELSKRLGENLEDNLSYVRDLAMQLSQPSTGPLVPKTPKMLRKRPVQRIETIPEDEVFKQDAVSSTSSLQSVVNEEEQKESEVGRRPRRETFKRAADNIKKQSLVNDSIKKVKTDNQSKRKKAVVSSSDEDTERVSKYSKVDENPLEVKEPKRMTRKKSKQIVQSTHSMELEKAKESEKHKEDNFESPALRRSSRASFNSASSKISQSSEMNKADAIVMPNADDVEEPSMYEDAIGKPVPIMNSTLKQSLVPERMLNATVIVERLPQQLKLNETVVIQKRLGSARNSKKSSERESAKKVLKDDVQLYKTSTQYKDYDVLITDDESSPEVKKPRKQFKRVNKRQIKSSSSEDEIPTTPVKTRPKDGIMRPAVTQESKVTHKPNALFSPYAKESVKKRVEAFEQAVMHSPKSVDVDAPTRLTRTKTRAMANAKMETEEKNAEKNVTQMLARKSLVRAKKISLAKQKKGHDEFKEVKESVNKEQLPERLNKLLLTQTEKPNVKQNLQQLKTTPLSKLKLMQPILSVNRLHTPSNTQNLLNYPKSLTASRANIVTGVDSFVQPKSMTKINSVEKLEEKGRYEEDARKKKEEALRLQTEEKKRKRQEKELKNKLAREAKEKQELEKRQKAEKEREEKAKLALVMQEKQREESERKRLALLQRIQEKEERRKLEEQQRLQRLQEQEETERSLAEQRRREQEAEKRKETEARAAQQAAAAEALKQKNQLLAAQAKQKQTNNKQQVENYVLDSEPDDDDSDDESKPKHEIPHWALPYVRKAQLAMQLYIPQEIVFKFFDTRKWTPDLTEIFQGIDKNRIKRTSSAIWKSPPRMSMMETEFDKP